ncbi:hypothetical protein DPV78_005390 [Talaromyces pinophilus]|nr:hypothetical protein DPV78_005390 [Talaromyces pinophilus]
MDTKEGLRKTQWPNSSTTLRGLPGHCANNEASQDQIIQESPAFSPEAIQAYNTGLDEERALSALAEKRFEEAESAYCDASRPAPNDQETAPLGLSRKAPRNGGSYWGGDFIINNNMTKQSRL